jgi:non-ribosomal peptide synthetase component F
MHNELNETTGLTAGETNAISARLLRARAALSQRAPACLHRLFEAQAALAPGAVALSSEGRTLTYGDLNARANRLARRLRALGVGPEVPVGLHADRSAEMVVGLLAVLKAGGAYVPLDPVYPDERLAYLVADSRVPVLLSRPSVLGPPPGLEAEVVDLDDPCDDEPEGDLPGSYRTPTSPTCWRPPGAGTGSGRRTSGPCSTPSPSTSRSGSSGAP